MPRAPYRCHTLTLLHAPSHRAVALSQPRGLSLRLLTPAEVLKTKGQADALRLVTSCAECPIFSRRRHGSWPQHRSVATYAHIAAFILRRL